MSSIDISTLLSETHYLQGQLSDSLFFQSDKKHINEIYDLLISCLLSHNHFYYIENKSIITDTEYDQLFDKLKKIESQNPDLIRDDSPTQKIVGQYEIQKEFKKSDHSTPILSLQNTYNTEEIMDRYDSISKMLEKVQGNPHPATGRPERSTLGVGQGGQLEFLLEPKYDGLAIILTYTDGVLTKAVTRGDGYTGDDVTENIKTIKNLPQFLSPLRGGMSEGQEGKKQGEPSQTIVRGEVLMPKSVRKRLNSEREESGEEPFANTRNAAAGSLKLLDTNEVAKRGLVCYIYDILQGEENVLNNFPQYTPPPEREIGGANIDSIISIISSPKTKEQLFKEDIDFDGLVIKIIDPEVRELLGSTNHHPRRAIAYKFPAQQIATQIEHIERQVGRTGILTPVAHVAPKELSGVTISRVSLHNRDFITSKNIKVNDRVRLQRSGEVIPYIVSVIIDRRDETQKEIDTETILCPGCGSHGHKIENEVGTKSNPEISTQWFCPNKDCPGILKEKLKHFVSKNCMNIASIGDSLIEILVSQGLVHSLFDLYSLTQPEKVFLLKRFPGLATKKIDTLIEELEKSKDNEFRRFLNALGIHGIGIKLAKEITSHLETTELKGNQLSISKLFEIISSSDFLSSIHGIGEILIQELSSWHSDEKNIKLLKEFEQHGLKPHYSTPLNTRNKEEISICITGTFPLSRSELEFYTTHAGYTFSPTLTKTTNYLFVGDNAGSKKDKTGPNTTIISDWTQICTMLDISVPLFESKEEIIPGGAMQSLFG